jgi:phosphatidylserine/phosphatidylglycerophosphate/cardiolipin synthase-like enzyme
VNQYLLARSLCDAAGWQVSLLRKAAAGDVVREITERVKDLRVNANEAPAILALACDLAVLRADTESTSIRVVSSCSELLHEDIGLWAIGQEWLELVRSARHTIIIVTPAFDEIAAANLKGALYGAYQAHVNLTLVYGSLGNQEKIESGLRVITSCFPSAVLLPWPVAHGFLHAKVICVDNSIAYLGSANLTDYGWQKNVELGVTLRGLAARTVARFCAGLIEVAQRGVEKANA